MTKDN